MMICFAILAHENEPILAQQVRNISDYNPGSKIVLYNSSGDPNFGRSIANLSICPYSRGPLAWGRTGRVLMDISAWLRETEMEYDYLVYIDSDVLFVKPGFETFLDKAMQGYDCMGVNMHQEFGPGDWIPGQSMWAEWHAWQGLFGTDFLCGMFANGQVYRRNLFHRMYDGLDRTRLESLFASTRVVALEEILHATLAVRCGGTFRDYPVPAAAFIRHEPAISFGDAKAAQQTGNIYFMHPIRRTADDPARRWIAEGIAEAPVPIPKKRLRKARQKPYRTWIKRRLPVNRRPNRKNVQKMVRKTNSRTVRKRLRLRIPKVAAKGKRNI
ncbi:hypothetical protein [Paenibacillus sp. MBLB4367]|uniref:hypothetical protein n=1 Tax=Paenibacillus sp. MBLB4367 TaxID=3384767 RepID=UPI003907F03B